MSLTVGQVGDNPFQPGITSETYIPDQLIAGDFKIVTTDIVVLHSAKLLRGTVLGQITLGAAASAAKGGGNTGTGTFVLDAAPVQANARAGVYTLRCIIAAANGGTFQLIDPIGTDLGTYIIPAGAGNSVAINDRIKGVLTDGGVDFIVGDGFDITIAAGSNKVIAAVATALDGSQVPVGILVDTVDASAADAAGGMYQTGEFNGAKLIYDASFSLAQITAALRPQSIFVKTPITAADPS